LLDPLDGLYYGKLISLLFRHTAPINRIDEFMRENAKELAVVLAPRWPTPEESIRIDPLKLFAPLGN
jgi:hypothetical protein